MTFLFYAVVVIGLLVIAYILLQMAPGLDPRFRTIIMIVLIIFGVLWLVTTFGLPQLPPIRR
jgi:hypothetical protein